MPDIKFNLFIKPPYYNADSNQTAGWEKVYTYGLDKSSSSSWKFNNYTKVKALGDATVYAACKGRLSVKAPEAYALAGEDNYELDSSSISSGQLPEKINLFLYFTPSTARFTCLKDIMEQTGEIMGFAYLNLETSSLLSSLEDSLQNAVIPSGSIPSSLILNHFLSGQMDIMVEAGATIGKAATLESNSTSRYLKFAVLSRFGMFDPSYLYGVLKSNGYLDEEDASWDSYINIFPYAWPFFSLIDEAEAINLSKSQTYSMLLLKEMRDKANLSYQKWREVGDNQKKIWRDRLLKKYGILKDDNIATFEYGNLSEDKNIFKLEAITEYFLDIKEPWLQNCSGSSGNPIVVTELDKNKVNFLNPKGVDASCVAGTAKAVKINDFPLMERDICGGFDYIKFEDDTKKFGIYRIVSFSEATNVMVLDNQPDFGALKKSRWEIVKSPNIVLIDPLGGNYRGAGAVVEDPSHPEVVKLPGLPKGARINKKFDTIYLKDDTTRTSKTYFIKAYDENTGTVTLDWRPEFTNGESEWSIPAGAGGTTEANIFLLGPSDNRGYDNYYGVFFLIHNEEVKETYQWTSYTSRKYDEKDPEEYECLSSIQGNKKYSYVSIGSRPKKGAAYRNYCYKVEDFQSNTNKCEFAKFYFTDELFALNDNSPDEGGKTGIRFHYGNPDGGGSGSAGCLVSPLFCTMRDRLIEIYQGIYKLKNNGSQDKMVSRIYRKDFEKSKTIWNHSHNNTGPFNERLPDEDWDNKMFGTLWLIRPDEKPL
ncbi:MAG: hypothetical protein N3B21_15235 [Clostridia bacterium]|nr:hypothetical protein [Clostridia bacterium]